MQAVVRTGCIAVIGDETVVVVAAVEDVVAIAVVGVAWFPPPLVHPATTSATTVTNTHADKSLATIVPSMTLAMLDRFLTTALPLPWSMACYRLSVM